MHSSFSLPDPRHSSITVGLFAKCAHQFSVFVIFEMPDEFDVADEQNWDI